MMPPIMTAKPKPERGPKTPADRRPQRAALTRAERASIARLEKAGLIISGPDAGKPLDDDDELLKPGPACPGAVEALIADRRSGL